MRILHAIATLDPDAGGPPQVACHLASAQASLGHDVHLVHYAGDAASRRREGAAAREIPGLELVTLHILTTPDLAERTLGRSAQAFFRQHLVRMDMLHLHGVWESMIRIGASEAHRQSKPYVVAPHGMLDPWSLAQKRWKKRLALAMGYRRALARADFLHCLNEDEARLLSPLGLGCKMCTIPNGILAEQFASLPPAGSFRRQHPELGNNPYVIFLARLHYKKGLDYLAHAFERVSSELPDLRLVVAGPDGGARADFEAAIARAGLSSRTHLVGPIYGVDKLAALVDASLFCLPSRQEGFSVAILEAMACATPVVITQNCHFPEVARASAGHVVPLEAAAVAEAITRILCDPVAAERMGQNGKEMVHQRYTWPAIANLSIQAYLEVIRPKSSD